MRVGVVLVSGARCGPSLCSCVSVAGCGQCVCGIDLRLY